jgi:hypothetical protein
MALVRGVGHAVGLDVHRDFCVVAICEDGKVRWAGRVPSTSEGLRLLAAIDPVWMRDERCRIVRRRLARRELLVRVRSRAKNEISAVLAPCRTCTGRCQITFSPGWRRPEPQRAASTPQRQPRHRTPSGADTLSQPSCSSLLSGADEAVVVGEDDRVNAVA